MENERSAIFSKFRFLENSWFKDSWKKQVATTYSILDVFDIADGISMTFSNSIFFKANC